MANLSDHLNNHKPIFLLCRIIDIRCYGGENLTGDSTLTLTRQVSSKAEGGV
jgi:hypothetical protein